MRSHAVATHLATHAQTLKYLCGVRTCADRTRLTQTVILSVSSLTYTTETMTLNYTLEAMSLGSTYYINISNIVEQLNSDRVTEIQLLLKTCELGQVSLGSGTGFLKVTHERSSRILLLSLLETKLNSCIAILLDTLNLRNHTRTSFDNSAWHILAISTEYGCHSDFLS